MKGSVQRVAARYMMKQADSNDLVWQLIPKMGFAKIHARLEKEDPQSADLLVNCLAKLEEELEFPNNIEQGTNKLRNLLHDGQNWDAALLRNNVFKVADLYGLKLPSAMFASQDKGATHGGRPRNYQYTSLADAVEETGDEAYRPGPTGIWYCQDDAMRDFLMGPRFVLDQNGELPTAATLSRTHKLIGKVQETHPDKIFRGMQGHIWSPEGQARSMLQKLGIGHTSMSVGDIIQVSPTKLLMVDRHGFYDLPA